MDISSLGKNRESLVESKPIELDREVLFFSGVTFDAGNLTLNGVYRDELSAHRAKRGWAAVLEQHFILDKGVDFKVSVDEVREDARYYLKCEFISACARYALWRLSNNQAPEAQYMIETAHIPFCEARLDDLLRAPDLRSKSESAVLGGFADELGLSNRTNGPLSSLVRRLLSKLKE